MYEIADDSALELLDVPQVAKRLRVSKSTVWRLNYSKKVGVSVKVGRAGRPPGQGPVESKYTFETFVIGSSNRFARRSSGRGDSEGLRRGVYRFFFRSFANLAAKIARFKG
jgi:hypothetical protein